MKISALDIDGNVKEYDVILTFYNDKYKKDYVVYTDNGYDDKDELRIYFNSYDRNEPEVLVKDIEDKEEYNTIKTEINKLLLTIKNESDKLE